MPSLFEGIPSSRITRRNSSRPAATSPFGGPFCRKRSRCVISAREQSLLGHMCTKSPWLFTLTHDCGFADCGLTRGCGGPEPREGEGSKNCMKRSHGQPNPTTSSSSTHNSHLHTDLLYSRATTRASYDSLHGSYERGNSCCASPAALHADRDLWLDGTPRSTARNSIEARLHHGLRWALDATSSDRRRSRTRPHDGCRTRMPEV